MSATARIGMVFLHDSNSSGSDISSFFNSIPLESFGDKSFTEVCDMLGILINTPTAQVRSGTDDEVDPSLFWEWFAVSPDWRVLGMDNTLKEDRNSMDLSKQQVSDLPCCTNVFHSFLYSTFFNSVLNLLTCYVVV